MRKNHSLAEWIWQWWISLFSTSQIALLKILLAAAPTSKAKTDSINILADVLPEEMPWVLQRGQLLDTSCLVCRLSLVPTHLVNTYRDCLQRDFLLSAHQYPLPSSGLSAWLFLAQNSGSDLEGDTSVSDWYLGEHCQGMSLPKERQKQRNQWSISSDRLISGNSGGFPGTEVQVSQVLALLCILYQTQIPGSLQGSL